jgi:energy-coupling factor transporter transmembrane protein EcfT
VINTLAQIDLIANRGRSPWHAASALAKLLLAAALVALSIAAPAWRLQLALWALAWMLALTARLPVRLLFVAASAPLLFVALLAIARWDGSFEAPLRLALRPLTATLAAVWLVGTTPYPDLFAPISRLLPRAAADGLFVTYRALFELLARAERLFRALRLRGATHTGPARRLGAAGEGLGTLVLYGFERGQRLHDVMLLRGHSGRICGCRHWAEWTPADRWVALAGAALLALAFAGWNAR